MSEAQLAALRDRLLAIPSDEVGVPEIAMATVLQEANDLLILIRDPGVWERLISIGVESSERDDLEQAIGATRAAQSQWMMARDPRKSAALGKREQQGAALRAELLAACRFNLRSDRAAAATLHAMARGAGSADLVQDLNDLAMLVEQKRTAFARDQSFDASKRIDEARALARDLAIGSSHERMNNTQADALALRNRAYSHLDGLVQALRAAGRYAFRGNIKQRKLFASAYLRRQRQRLAADKPTPPAPEQA